ncbi:MCP four helix bundle domain-containing protein, partial [Azospirillum sp.]|uniref:MCP four helix bundle domain-containing protein n=1 Tax=Azospirillum sp. TaxID=34012 RepID=UPI002D3C6498
MNTITIRAKLLVAFSALFLFIVGLGLFAVNRLEVIGALTVEMEQNWLAGTRWLGMMNGGIGDYRIAEARHIIADDDAAMELAERDIGLGARRVDEALAKYEPLATTAAERDGLKLFRTAWAEYQANNKVLVELSRKNEND